MDNFKVSNTFVGITLFKEMLNDLLLVFTILLFRNFNTTNNLHMCNIIQRCNCLWVIVVLIILDSPHAFIQNRFCYHISTDAKRLQEINNHLFS